MHSSLKLILMMFVSLFYVLEAAAETVNVSWVGELKNVMQNDDRKSRVCLADLEKRNLYALGPAENLDGEITVLDGWPSISHVDAKGGSSVDHLLATKAPTLVYTNVEQWQDFAIPITIQSAQELESFIAAAAKKAGLNIERPFPFLLKGHFAEVDFHILRGSDASGVRVFGGDRVPFVEKNVQGTVLGFFSKHHQGIFTHKDSFVHIHFVSESDLKAGHVENLRFVATANMQLKLPTANF